MSSSVPAGLYQSVKMANDIARNMGAGRTEQEATDAVAGHMKKFWPPSMIAGLVDNLSLVEADLLGVAKLAVLKLADDD